MKKYYYHEVPFDLVPDLHKIIKYHPASKIYLELKTRESYTTTVNLFIIATKVKKDYFPIPDYDIKRVFATFLPSNVTTEDFKYHMNNIIVMVKNMVVAEWSYYKSYSEDFGNEPYSDNPHERIIHILKQMLEVAILYEKLNVETQGEKSEMKIDVTFRMDPKLKEKEKLNLNFLSIKEKLGQLKFLFIILKKRLVKQMEILPIQSLASLRINSISIENHIKKLKQPFKDKSALRLFSKFVCETIREYMVDENGHFKKFSIYTTRYFEAWDLKDKDATLILITDVNAKNTKVGISNKGFQALGRLRGKAHRLIHITNHAHKDFKRELKYFKEKHTLYANDTIASYNIHGYRCKKFKLRPYKKLKDAVENYAELSADEYVAKLEIIKIDQFANHESCNEEYNNISFIQEAWERSNYNVIRKRVLTSTIPKTNIIYCLLTIMIKANNR
jgi:hypothetical protein